jgi:hypothetical protein
VRSAAEQIEDAGLHEVIVVGHSLAGLTASGMHRRAGILTLRDHALFRRTQLRSIAALGGVQTLIPVDTCHDLMISEPRLLAEILIDRCYASQTTCVTLVLPVDNYSTMSYTFAIIRTCVRVAGKRLSRSSTRSKPATNAPWT